MRGRLTARALALGAALAGLSASVGAAHAQDVAGTWLTESGTSRVRIAPCGAVQCGTITWTKAGTADTNNPDPAQRSRPLLGMRMISDIKRSGEGWAGQLYNPLDGKTYTGKMRLKSPRELEMSGCVLGGLICKSQTWTRVN